MSDYERTHYERIRADRIAMSKSVGDYYRSLAAQVGTVTGSMNQGTFEQPTIDAWMFATDDSVMPLIEAAARKVAKVLPTVDFEDAAQEGTIIVVERFEEYQERLERGTGLFVNGLYQDLNDKFKATHKRLSRVESIDADADMGLV